MNVPNSSGAAPPRLKAPPDACDCHMHIYDGERFPPARPGARMTANAGVPQYRLLQQRIGTSRVVVVQPAANHTDNSVTLDALARFGPQACGIAVVHPTVTDAELNDMMARRIRGIRFTQFDPRTAATSLDMIEPLANRAAPLGLHVQIHWRADQIAGNADLLMRLPGTLVFDHLGRLPNIADPGFVVLRRLLDKGNTWIKLSGAYMVSEPPAYPHAAPIARAYIEAAPERMVWGSDWPHPTEDDAHKPDDAALFDLLSDWAPDDSTRHRILVDNPAVLYGFPK